MMLICQNINRDIPDHSGQKMSGGLSMKAKSQFDLFLEDEVAGLCITNAEQTEGRH